MELGALGQDGELDIFSNYEFAKHNYDLNRILKLKNFLHLVDRTRIVQLKMKRSTLRKLAKKVSSEHNVIKFCTNIITLIGVVHLIRNWYYVIYFMMLYKYKLGRYRELIQ